RQLRSDFPFVVRIQAHAPQGDWNIARQIQCLPVLVGLAVYELLQAGVDITEVNSRRGVEEIVIAHVVAAEVHAEFQVVLSAHQRKVVDELVLRDVAPLREVAQQIEAARKRHGPRGSYIVWESAAGQLLVLRELGYVMAERGHKLVCRSGPENVRL